jgi:hypothetical protein
MNELDVEKLRETHEEVPQKFLKGVLCYCSTEHRPRVGRDVSSSVIGRVCIAAYRISSNPDAGLVLSVGT